MSPYDEEYSTVVTLHKAGLMKIEPTSCSMELTATAIGQQQVADETYILRLDCPDLAQRILPGQFFMIRIPDEQDPLLGRPFAMLDRINIDDQPVGIELGYHVVGKLTRQLPHIKSGTKLELWGPLGNGFPELNVKHLACVAGGIGYTPFVGVCKAALGLSHYTRPDGHAYELKAERVSFLYGARTSTACAEIDPIGDAGHFHLAYATEDGSRGTKGFVTQLLIDLLESDTPPDAVFTCGPEIMMQKVAEICQQFDVDCWVSLETPMACGFGACFSCVTRIRQNDGSWDYRRSCVEGPVFPGHLMAWDA